MSKKILFILCLSLPISQLASARVTTITSWDTATRQKLYSLSTGGRLLPTDWAQALEVAGAETPFFSKQILTENFGLVWNDLEPQKNLPIGVGEIEIRDNYSTDFDMKGKFVGFNCLACHTGELHYKNDTLYIDGGAGRFAFQNFISGLRSAVEDTADLEFGLPSAKLSRFHSRIQSNKITAYQTYAYLETIAYGFRSIAGRPVIEAGPGRMDVINSGISALALFGEKNRRDLVAPLSTPPIWGAHKHDYMHWGGSIHQALGRDISATTAGGAAIDFRQGNTQFRSSMDLDAIKLFQDKIAELKPPVWPEQIFGTLDRSRVSRGKTIYESKCNACHTPQVAGDESRIQFIPLNKIGTDPNYIRSWDTDIDVSSIGLGVLKADRFFETLTTRVAEVKMTEMGLQPNEYEKYTGPRPNTWRQPVGYKAVPLDGVWSTPPYLHNGSVISLNELFLPAKDRIKKFNICVDTEYDPENVGYLATETRAKCTLIDTAVSGNMNTGHEGEEYGTNLSAEERRDLIEYLKSF